MLATFLAEYGTEERRREQSGRFVQAIDVAVLSEAEAGLPGGPRAAQGKRGVGVSKGHRLSGLRFGSDSEMGRYGQCARQAEKTGVNSRDKSGLMC